jgi:3-hydroxybutyryl-CoA dehydrogenase
MGAGIAEVVARTGIRVIGVELDQDSIARAREHVEHSTDRARSGGKLDDAARAALLDRITYTTSLADLADADLVVEAIPESLELKARVFTELEEVCRPDVILASNTSSLSVTEIGVHTGRPGKVVGLHFFNPAPVLKLVEIVRTVVTEPDVVADVEAFAATGPGSSRTRCCSAISTTRCPCTSRTTRPGRTSTPRCGSAAATRWARSRCST